MLASQGRPVTSLAGVTWLLVTYWMVLGWLSGVGQQVTAQHPVDQHSMMNSSMSPSADHTVSQQAGSPPNASHNSSMPMAGSASNSHMPAHNATAGNSRTGSDVGPSHNMVMDTSSGVQHGDGSMTSETGGHQTGGHGSTASSSNGHYGSFHITYQTVILFEQWITNTWQGFLGSCFGVGLAAMLYEGLKSLKVLISRKFIKRPAKISVKVSMVSRLCSCPHLFLALLHMFQMVYSYFIMLVFMTFNVWLCVAIAIGFGIGYLVFRDSSDQSVDDNEHCM